mmetsp:Transcript_19659/g.30350  ORF Transcript_19659/g.30350 Transcript_19659/m.30350 type:complete len:97 (+) Transcript_19659:1810-2100(+)
MLLLVREKASEMYEIQEISAVRLLKKLTEVNLEGTLLDGKSPDKYDAAILLNSCDQGYGIFSLDSMSVYFFERNLNALMESALLKEGSFKFTKTHF